MVTHVGVDLVTCRGLVYDTTTKQQRSIVIAADYRNLNYFNEFMRSIITQIQGELGCICFCWQYNYGEKTKSDLITNAKNFGFIDVKIIDDCRVKCWFGLSSLSIQPKNGNIWSIDWNFKTFVFTIFVWECNNGKLQYVKKVDTIYMTETLVLELSKNGGGIPNITVYYFFPKDNAPDAVVKVVLHKIFPDCIISFPIPDYYRNCYQVWALKEAMSENPYHLSLHDIVATENINTDVTETAHDEDFEVLALVEENNVNNN